MSSEAITADADSTHFSTAASSGPQKLHSGTALQIAFAQAVNPATVEVESVLVKEFFAVTFISTPDATSSELKVMLSEIPTTPANAFKAAVADS